VKNYDEREIVDCLGQLGKIEPDAESTRRGIQRAREALLGRPAHEPATRRRKIMMPRLRTAAAIIVLVGLTTAAAWFVLSSVGAASALAGVQQAMSRVKSVTFDATARISDQPERKMKVLILGADLSRLELPDGDVAIADRKKDRSVLLKHREKKAVVVEGFVDPEKPVNVYDRIRNARSCGAKRVGKRTVNGKALDGFQLTEDGRTTRVWIDPETELPARIESTEPLPGGGQVVSVGDNFVFDAELDPSLFSTTPPADYAIETRVAPKRSAEGVRTYETLLVIKPEVGLGPVHFGVSEDQVIQGLGKPDRRETTPGGEALHYDSRGFAVYLDPQGRFATVKCVFYPDRTAPVARSFQGKTDKGIKIGSSYKAVVEAYGPADYGELEGKKRRMQYGTLPGMDFYLVDDKVTTITAWWKSK